MFLVLILLAILVIPHPVLAIYNPLSVPNNRYGIHIVDTNDLTDLPALLNTSGGDWGYVTMVLSDNERDGGRWQTLFNEFRRMHLVPIIRLATHVEGGVWVRPTKDRLYELVTLLNSLNWPTENRYVILYNEPNHAKEWGGTLDPEDYADTFVLLAKALKAANEDFFVLPAGLDASSASDGNAMDEAAYLEQMIAARPEILTLMDGWTSHSYPNPGFSGSPYARGRGTLGTFDWELGFLRARGLTRDLPVFITETGWEHSEGKSFIGGLLTSDQVAGNIQIAASGIWTDPRIAAITPFLYNYQDTPFDHFSWRRLGSADMYPMYDAYRNLPKTKGQPKQRESYILKNDLLPKKLVAGSTYTLRADMQNTGQGILSVGDYMLTVSDGDTPIPVIVDPLPYLEPENTGTITIHVQMPNKTGTLQITATLHHNDQSVLLQARQVALVPPPSVEIRSLLGWRKTGDASNVSVLVYDNNTLLQKFTGLSMKEGIVTARGLTNIIPGNPYRVVILVPGYLPRQVIGALQDKTTTIYPKRFLPLDFSGDGQFSWADILVGIQIAPLTVLARFFGP